MLQHHRLLGHADLLYKNLPSIHLDLVIHAIGAYVVHHILYGLCLLGDKRIQLSLSLSLSGAQSLLSVLGQLLFAPGAAQ